VLVAKDQYASCPIARQSKDRGNLGPGAKGFIVTGSWDEAKRLDPHVSDLGADWDSSRFMVRPTVVAPAPVRTARASPTTKAGAVAALQSDSPRVNPPQNSGKAGSLSRQSPQALAGI
jgi:hypothetical protein